MENRLKISTIDLPIFVMVAKIFMNCSQVIQIGRASCRERV